MTTKTRHRLVLINSVLLILLFVDYFVLVEVKPPQKIDAFYKTTVQTKGGRQPTYEDRKILQMESGETFRLGKLPKQDYKKGQKVQLIVSSFSGNVNEIIILNDNNEKEQVGILSIWYFKGLLILTLIVCVINAFSSSRVWETLMIVVSMFTWIFTLIYLFWFSR